MLGIIGFTDGTLLSENESTCATPFFVSIANHDQVRYFFPIFFQKS